MQDLAVRNTKTLTYILADDFPREWVGTRIRHSVPLYGCGAAAITNDFVASNAIVLVTLPCYLKVTRQPPLNSGLSQVLALSEGVPTSSANKKE